MRHTWAALAPYVDPDRHREVSAYLVVQESDAHWWRDASIAYFQSVSHRPLPAGSPAPLHPLSFYEAIDLPYAPAD
jgi:alpha-glucuronidase